MSLAAERRVNLRLSIPPEASNSICNKEHQCEKISNARVMKARERRISMLTRILEPSCNEPFYFLYITAKDGALSNEKSGSEFKKFLLHVNTMKPVPKFIVLCGGFINDQLCEEDDVLARKFCLEEELLNLDQRIKVLYVASSGDFKGCLNDNSVDNYRLCFGDDWYEFWVCGVAFLVINTVYYRRQIDGGVIAIRNEQNDWIDSQLLQQQIFQAKRTIILQDRGPTTRSYGNKEEEDAEEEMLGELLVKYKIAGVSHLLCRENQFVESGEADNCGIEVLPNAINDSDEWFVRLVKINTDGVYHESFTLQGLPQQVYL